MDWQSQQLLSPEGAISFVDLAKIESPVIPLANDGDAHQRKNDEDRHLGEPGDLGIAQDDAVKPMGKGIKAYSSVCRPSMG